MILQLWNMVFIVISFSLQVTPAMILTYLILVLFISIFHLLPIILIILIHFYFSVDMYKLTFILALKQVFHTHLFFNVCLRSGALRMVSRLYLSDNG